MDSCRMILRKQIASLVVVLLCMAFFPLVAQADEVDDMLSAGDYVEGEVVAAFRARDGQLTAHSTAPYEVTPLITVDSSAARAAANDGLTTQSAENLTLTSVASDSLTTEELLRMLADDPNVGFVEPNYTFSLEGANSDDFAATQVANISDVTDLTPMQWGNWATDQTMRTEAFAANPSINVPGFGSTQSGANMDKPIVVALIDTAVDHTHPDLDEVMYHFSAEQQAALGCHEWGYKSGDKGLKGNFYDPKSLAIGHGTHTAGIIGAEWNDFGTSGVASNVRIVSIDFLNEIESGSIADVLCAFSFVDQFNGQASEEGERVRVTSNSWGLMQSSRAIDAAVRELGDRWGIVSVFSSGNLGRSNDHLERANSYLQDNPYAIIVANTNGTDALDATSEYGVASVDLAAPGTTVLSTVIESEAHYLADATGLVAESSDPLYVGFDGKPGEPPVTVSQLYEDGKPDLWHDNDVVAQNAGAYVNTVRAYGTGGLKISVDPEHAVDTSASGKYKFYDLKLDIDLTNTDITAKIEGQTGLHLGFMFTGGTESVGALVWSCATNLANIEFNLGTGTSGNADWLDFDKVVTEVGSNGKAIEGEAAPTGAALHPADDHLVIKLRVALPIGCTTFGIDSLGLGTKVVPYGFRTGTSMSTPLVAGSAAVLAAQGHSGTELASLTRSKVRIPNSPLEVKSGGVFDFSADGSTEPTGSHALAPDITDVVVDGTTVTITGANFGASPGSVDLSRYVVGAELQPVAATVASWSDDTVKLSLEAPFEGILRVVLTNVPGKHDTHYRFASKGSDVYEQDLPFDASVGNVFVSGDGQGDWETTGPLVGCGCKLYYLPGYGGADEIQFGHKRMLCFDLKKQEWSELCELPEWLSGVSAVMFDGKIVVEGATVHMLESGEHTTTFPAGTSAEERVYVYDPTKNSWTQASSDGVRLNQTVVNDRGQLKLVGGSMGPTAPAPVTSYDLSSGAGEELCSMPAAYDNPQVAANEGTLLVYSNSMTATLAAEVIRIQGGQATQLMGALPEFVADSESINQLVFSPTKKDIPFRSVVAPASDGFVLVGPPAADGSSDTYVLRNDSDKFEPHAKRSSDDCVYSQAACTYRGRLFVIGASLLEPNNRLFRATAMEVPEYPGDIPCDVKPEPEPTVSVTAHVQRRGTQPAVFGGKVAGTTGKSLRMESLRLTVDGAPVSGGIEYRGHVQRKGWEKSWIRNGKLSGTEGKSRRLEAVQIRLWGDMAKKYDVWYRVHVQRYGWMAWAKNGQSTGTQGMSRRAEAIQVVLVAKGGPAPAKAFKGATQTYAKAFAKK